MESVHLQLPADLLARVDEAAGDVPRNRWIRRAIEGALGILSESGDSVTLRATYTASQLDDLAARRVSEISPVRSTAQVKRDVQPATEGEAMSQSDSTVNTHGHSVFKASWEDLWRWNAWTPSGLIMGTSPTEAQAHADAKDAIEKTKLVPQGQG